MLEGTITDKNKYTLSQVIRCYDVDSRMLLRPSAFMDYAQEMAYQAAEAMGFGYNEMIKDGKAWVLSRLNFVFEDTPRWGEQVNINTWHKGPSGPFYIRDFTVTNPADGKIRVRATSSWVILDIVARRMVRTSDVMEIVNPETQRSEDAIAENAQRISMPRGAEPVKAGTHTVGYSDIDLQQHTNNARYVLWAMNCIDCELIKEHPFKEITINFNHETLAGNAVDLYVLKDNLTYYVEGTCNGNQVFCLKVTLYD
ncbi:MAG: hypothetical protein IJ151_08180 [Bacteroidales bacterium]|nr:hypothetical protein [Bacteroidales bacterium]